MGVPKGSKGFSFIGRIARAHPHPYDTSDKGVPLRPLRLTYNVMNSDVDQNQLSALINRIPRNRERRVSGFFVFLKPMASSRSLKVCWDSRDFPSVSHHWQQAMWRSPVSSPALGSSVMQQSATNPASTSCSLKYASVADSTAGGGAKPSCCQLRHPWMAHRSIPGYSAYSFSESLGSRSPLATVTLKGMKCRRRRIASLTSRNFGLWLPATSSLNCGT
jgi:hypothetical protein